MLSRFETNILIALSGDFTRAQMIWDGTPPERMPDYTQGVWMRAFGEAVAKLEASGHIARDGGVFGLTPIGMSVVEGKV